MESRVRTRSFCRDAGSNVVIPAIVLPRLADIGLGCAASEDSREKRTISIYVALQKDNFRQEKKKDVEKS
jgi:hypothetical protein